MPIHHSEGKLEFHYYIMREKGRLIEYTAYSYKGEGVVNQHTFVSCNSSKNPSFQMKNNYMNLIPRQNKKLEKKVMTLGFQKLYIKSPTVQKEPETLLATMWVHLSG